MYQEYHRPEYPAYESYPQDNHPCPPYETYPQDNHPCPPYETYPQDNHPCPPYESYPQDAAPDPRENPPYESCPQDGQPCSDAPQAEPPAPRLVTCDCDTLIESRFERPVWVVENLLRPGLAVLAGSPKVGKSWLVLQLCLHVAQGKAFWGSETRQGSVLYIALEDSPRRLQDRVLTCSQEGTPDLHFAVSCEPLGDGLEEQLRAFKQEFPSTRLIVLDTFQKVRASVREMSYANDYKEVSALKKVADELGVCLLLVHHTRKQADTDYMNEISGTNGIAGSADTLMVLKKEKRTSRTATLSCTGRDIEDRELELRLERKGCIWTVVRDSLNEPDRELPDLIRGLIGFMKEEGAFNGSNAAFAVKLSAYMGQEVDTAVLKRLMNKYRYEMEDNGVTFANLKNKGVRCIGIVYNRLGDIEEEQGLWDDLE